MKTTKMPINRGAIIRIIEEISLAKGLNCTITEGLKGAAKVGVFAFGGALLGGPIGLGIGGTIGSILTAISSRGKYKPVITVLQEELTAEQLMKLENSFRVIFQDIDITDVVAATTLIMNTPNLQALVLKQLGTFLRNEMALQLV